MGDMMRMFDGTCPWCGLSLDVGMLKPPLPMSRRCVCGAVALACAERRRVVDAMIGYFGVCPAGVHERVYESREWLKDFWIEAKSGGPGTEARTGLPLEWWWFRRSLPWDPPVAPEPREERLSWLVAHAEKFLGMTEGSKSPRFEFRESRMAFEEAIALAIRLGRDAQVKKLRERLAQVKAEFRRRFDIHA